MIGNFRRTMNKKNLIPIQNFEDFFFWNSPINGTVYQIDSGLVEGYKSIRFENKTGNSELNWFRFPAKPNTPYSIEFKYKADSNHRVTALAYNGNTHVNNVQINVVGDKKLNKGRIEITTGEGVTEIRLGPTLTSINTYMEITNPIMLIGLGQSEPYDLLEILNGMKDGINPLKGKILYGEGDSIMEGAGFVGGFLKMIANKYSMNSHNIGVGGATIATGTTWSNGGNRHWISKSIEGLDKNCDFLMVEGSVNDYYNNVPLGEVSVGYRDSKIEFNTTNFAGAMEYLCMVLVTEFKGIDSVFILPHRINRIDYTTNTLGLTYQEYRDVAKAVCRKYGVDLIDLGERSGLVTYWLDNKTKYTDKSDGLHPNELGYAEFYLPPLVDWMMSRSH